MSKNPPSHIPQREVDRANSVDLLTYLEQCEPDNLKKICTGVYTTLEHDSLQISNGKWYWHSKGIGGHTAVQFLMKVREMRYPDAIRQVLRYTPTSYLPIENTSEPVEKVFQPPKRNFNHNRVIAYLEKRGISRNVIFYCIKQQILYESKDYHSAVFIGKDAQGVPKYGNIRSTNGSFKGECKGSDKRYAFSLHPPTFKSNTLHVFEASIDALSFATYAQLKGTPWQNFNLLALGGISGNSQKVPTALQQFLSDHPEIKALHLHLDNDMPGREAAKHITKLLSEKYTVKDAPPATGKDVNDFLLAFRGMSSVENVPHQNGVSL